MHFFFLNFFFLESAPPFVTFTSLAPLKYEAIAFLSQMSYRLTFKLSEQSDYLIFVWNLTEVSHYNVLFFLKHDNNPQIPNNVIESI